MAQNYETKHSQIVDEAFGQASVFDAAINKDYDFTGARSVKVHSVPTVSMGDYTPEGTGRFGSPSELGDEVQELTMVPDRAFTFTVDKGNSQDDAALNAGKALRRQIDEVASPERDIYNAAKMASGAGLTKYGLYTGSGNAGPYERILDMQAALDAALAPAAGRLCYVNGAFYKSLKLDSNFVRSGDIAQNQLIKGQIGEIDGLPILKDYGRLPAGVACMDRSQISTYLTNYFAETSTDVTSLLKTNASDWGKIFGMAIPEGAKTGLDNGMFQLRSATGQVIAEVSAVNAKATVETGNKDTAQAGIDAASQTLDDGKTTVGTSAQGVADAIGTPFENLPEDQKVQAAVMMEGINSAITAGTPAATTAIETAANAVTDKAAEILNSAKGSTIGQDFVGGITTGVQNKQSALRTGLQTAASSGVGATSTAMQCAQSARR